LATTLIIALTPQDYRAEPFYSLIFYRILPGLENPREALNQLGLRKSDVSYSGTHSYSQGAAVVDPGWRQEFIARITYRRLASYYLGNPSVLLDLLERGLLDDASGIRPGNIGNYQRKDGFPPFALARRFDWWSNLRSRLLRVFPAHVALFYAAMSLGSLLCLWRGTWAARWPLYPLALLLAASGVVEFLMSVLLDGTETARHLFLFHVITELLVILAFPVVLNMFARITGVFRDRLRPV
jgi:hypothetical protein